MSNTAYLYNLASPAVVINGAAQGTRQSVKGMVVAETPNCVPLPWLLAFTPADIRPVDALYRTGPVQWSTRRVLVPVASVASALDTFLRRRAELTRLIGDGRIAEGFIRLTCDGLAALPLPYVALDPLEVVDLNDTEEPSRSVQRALGAAAAAARFRVTLSGFVPGVVPYAADTLYAMSPDKLTNKARLQNAVAVDPSFLPSSQWRASDLEPPPMTGPGSVRTER
jgi:hypothetical protein